jgi:hypothetical protein
VALNKKVFDTSTQHGLLQAFSIELITSRLIIFNVYSVIGFRKSPSHHFQCETWHPVKWDIYQCYLIKSDTTTQELRCVGGVSGYTSETPTRYTVESFGRSLFIFAFLRHIFLRYIFEKNPTVIKCDNLYILCAVPGFGSLIVLCRILVVAAFKSLITHTKQHEVTN